jgi:hypothetical protein
MANLSTAARWLCCASLLSVSLVACAGASMKAQYAKSAVQPVEIEKISEDQLSIHYTMPAESLYYSPGVNFRSEDGTLRVYIDRCHIKDKCDPMAKVPLPPKNGWKVAVNVPYKGEKVLMVYTDAEEQVYP